MMMAYFQELFSMAQKTKVVEKKTVIVAGIHGVGKTTFTNKYMVSSGWNCYTASHIIKNFSGAVNSDKKTKLVDAYIVARFKALPKGGAFFYKTKK